MLSDNAVDGMFVTDVDAGSTVEKAHIGQGDLIRTTQGAPVTTTRQVCDVIESILPGTVIRVTGNRLTSASDMSNFGTAWAAEFATPGKH